MEEEVTYTNAELRAMAAKAAEELIETGDVESVDELIIQRVYIYLRKKKVQVAEIPDYKKATYISELVKRLQERMHRGNLNSISEANAQRLETRLSNARERLHAAERMKHNVKERFASERQASLEKLQQKHQQALDELDERANGPLPKRYCHHSAEYHQLEQQELYFRRAERYDEAQTIHDELEAVGAYENEMNRNRYLADMAVERNALLQKQKRETDVFNEWWDRKWAAIEPEAKTREVICRRNIHDIEGRLRKEKVAMSQQPSARTTSRLPRLYGDRAGNPQQRSPPKKTASSMAYRRGF